MSVEDNENIEEEFNKILKAEYSQDWLHIKIPPKLIAVFCFTLPALLMLSGSNYHHNITVTLFFSLVMGTGFYAYYRYHKVFSLFFSESKPLNQIIREVRAQDELENRFGMTTPAAPDNKAPEEEYADFDTLIQQLEASMEPDEMNLTTLFDRADSEPATLNTPKKRTSWFRRLLGRK